MARDDPKFIVRLPSELKERLQDAAREGKRSMNAEIVERLQGSFADVIAVGVPRGRPLTEAQAVAIAEAAASKAVDAITDKIFAIAASEGTRRDKALRAAEVINTMLPATPAPPEKP